MKIDSRNPAHWALLFQQLWYCVAGIIARFLFGKSTRPSVILYGHQLSGNLKSLYDEWRRGDRGEFDCHFLSLDPQYALALHDEGINVLRCNSLRDMLLVSRCSAMITDHGLHAMLPLLHYTDIIFIDVWHGIPFKGFIPDDFRVQHQYHEVWVSSSLLRDIYVDKFGFPPEIVHPLGYARADKLFRGDKADYGLRELADIPEGNRVVLYAPTWQQDDEGRELFPFGESQDAFIGTLNDICRSNKATLVIRSHLNTHINTKFFENVRYCSMRQFPDTEGLLMLTDILICDWSSIAFDFLALDRPTIFLDVEPPFKNGFSLGPEYRFGKIVVDMDSLGKALDRILGNPQDYATEFGEKHRKIIAEVYESGSRGKAAAHQLSRLENLIGSSRNATK